MSDAAAVSKSLHAIGTRTAGDMSERDVENLFLETGFYDALGFEGTGTDLRSEFTLPDDRRPDYITLDSNEAVTTVYEFKTTGKSLPQHRSQLFGYMDYLRSEYGVLTNGEELRLYRRGKDRPQLIVSLDAVTDSDARDLVSALQKREFDLTDPDDVNGFLANLDPIPLDKQAELGQEHFFDTFRLEEGSPFADLVTGMMDLLEELRDDQEAKFVKGAYDFWEATYASEPDEVPDSWDPFIGGNQSLRDFMFCLESGHALLSRLLLAKATEDHDFFAGIGYRGMDDYFRGLQGFGQSINLDAFPVAADNLIDDMSELLVEGLFQDDIFVWWTDGYKEEISRGHETGASQFTAVATGRGDEGGVERISDATRNRFSRAVAEVFFNILRFNFEDVEGDLLGDLYQRYFDPETRKALGEFYTPQPVIDYIMDGVGYERGVSNERLIDPACGSGTFIVEAVERYLADVKRYEEDPDWKDHLQDLCTRPRVVGLDIHPFAVLMARIRFVVAVLPAYRKAKQKHPEYTIRRLPIYRTDTLRNERELTGTDLGEDGSRQITFDAMTDDEQDVRIPVPLPVEVDESGVDETEDGFLVRRVRMPLFNTIQLETGVSNFGEYFAALQGVLDTVKDHMALAEEFGGDFDWTYQSGLEERIHHHTDREYDGVEEFFEPYVNDMLENVRYLKEEHNDGRLFKMFEDTVLALVVKNYMNYDYVVGNPPYVSSQNIPDWQKQMLGEQYPDSATDQYDLYCPFIQRGLNWLNDGDRLGYITPNQFMVANYGNGVRSLIDERAVVEQIQDFRDSGVFKDATNYPVISIFQIEDDEDTRENNTIRCGRVKSNINEDSGRELDQQIVATIRSEYNNPGYSDEYVDIYDFPQSRLTETRWPIMPEREWEIFEKIEAKSDYVVGDVTEAVFQGIMTGRKGVFIVEVLDAEMVKASDSGGSVRIRSLEDGSEHEIETDVLRPFIDGDEVERWQVTWGGLHIINPYRVVESSEEASVEPIPEEIIASDLPLTMAYLNEYKDLLTNRSSLRSNQSWYEYSRPQNMDKFERPKLLLSKIAERATYMSDSEGTWYFTTPYSVLLDSEQANLSKEMTAQLNSNVLDFYFKHIAAVKAGGFYEYLNQYITPVPCVVHQSDGEFDRIRRVVDGILSALHTENRSNRFPEAYLGDFTGEMDFIGYEWQTRRDPVNAEIQGDVDGEFTVQAGRSDEIKDPAMYSGDREARKRRAEYVHAAVDGRSVKSGEETTIPIPRSDDGVVELLECLEADRTEVEETDIAELEAEIDEAVYDLFDLTAEERAVVEDYLEVL